MPSKIMRSNKVVILLTGRYAGRKAIIVKTNDDGSGDKSFGHALVVGIDRYPRKVVRGMGKKRMAKRSRIKPFIKVSNYNHLMPTRYTVDIAFDRNLINREDCKDPSKKRKALSDVRHKFEERYKAGRNRWFFSKLRF